MLINNDAHHQSNIAKVLQNQIEEPATNRIHFFKFDQRILTFYNLDTDKKTRELLSIDFNIPIRFSSI